MQKQTADKETDRLYANLRDRHGGSNPAANGYRLEKYFLKEQEMVLSKIPVDSKIIVDLACGSGLMTKPLTRTNRLVVGIDFNATACRDAKVNQINVVQGDAFNIPLANSSVDNVINCQFLNQQPKNKAEHLLVEIYRVLKPGGRLIMVWRNDRALIHKLALYIYRYIDKLTGHPVFPYYDNYIGEIVPYCRQIGFSVISKFLTFPLLSWNFHNLNTFGAKTLGASCFIVLEKPGI